jgi:hypothetical protein
MLILKIFSMNLLLTGGMFGKSRWWRSLAAENRRIAPPPLQEDDLCQGNGAVLFHLNGPEKSIQGHQVRHFLDKVMINLGGHIVNIDRDGRSKAFISSDLAHGRSWTQPGEYIAVQKPLTLIPSEPNFSHGFTSSLECHAAPPPARL